MNFDVACNMEFYNYPIDEQVCEIKMESFGYTNRQMKFAWMNGKYKRLRDTSMNVPLPENSAPENL